MSLKIHLVWSQMGFFSGNKVDIPAVNFPILQDQATPLWIASQMGHTSVVKELLSSGADVDAIREVEKKSPDFLYMPPFVSNETWSDCLGFILLKIFNSMSLECLTDM